MTGQLGDFPIRTLTLNVGDRRPLGVGAGSLALLAFQDADEIDGILAAVEGELAVYPGFDVPTVRRLVSVAREQGYAFNNGRLVRGMSAVGVPVLMPGGEVAAALSIAAISSRMEGARRAMLVEALQTEAANLIQAMSPLSEPSFAHGAR